MYNNCSERCRRGLPDLPSQSGDELVFYGTNITVGDYREGRVIPEQPIQEGYFNGNEESN